MGVRGEARARRTHVTRAMGGFTLLEWVIAMPLGLLIVVAATAIYLAGLRLWRVQAERYDVNERAVFALTQLTRAVGMAGYRNWDPMEGLVGQTSKTGGGRRPEVLGALDWTSLRAGAECASAIETCPKRGWQGSAMLEVQFHGAGLGVANGAVHNCAGLSGRALNALNYRHISSFYVAKGEDGVPSLFCRYGERGAGVTELRQAQVLVIGVEAMYLRLGIRVGAAGPLRWVSPNKNARRKPPNPPAGGWDKIEAVAISLVLRGAPRRGGKPRAVRVVEVFDAATGGREYLRLNNAGDVHLHVFNAVAYRRNEGGAGGEAKWSASSL